MNFPPLRFPSRRPLAVLLACTAFMGSIAAARADEAKPTVRYKILTNDKLRIVVFQEEDLSNILRVDAHGDVIPTLLPPVHVANETLEAAAKAIETAYRDGRFLVHPQVSLTVEDYAPREVSVGGWVKTPARYPLTIESSTTLIDIISKAGGFQDSANGKDVRVTRYSPDGTAHVYDVDVESVLRGREKDKTKIDAAHMLLEPGDLIYVPERLF